MEKVSRVFMEHSGVEGEEREEEEEANEGDEALVVGSSISSVDRSIPSSTIVRLSATTVAAVDQSNHANNHAVEYFRS